MLVTIAQTREVCSHSRNRKSIVCLLSNSAFLSWLRLSVYMAIVSVAIMISFHLKRTPSDVERHLALPFGIVFWCLSMACLLAGVANYIKTVSRYSRRAALVQSGWKTEVVNICFSTSLVEETCKLISSPGLHDCCNGHSGCLRALLVCECR